MSSEAPVGVLLMNTGTPDAPTPEAIRPYLAEFLSDRYIVDRPRWMWQPILHLFILPSRPRRTAERYRRIWTPGGSPFMTVSRSQCAKLQERLDAGPDDVVCELAMRYGNPSVSSALDRLQGAGCERLVVLPLFPQHARVTTETCIVRVLELLEERDWHPRISTVSSYCDRDDYLDALAESVRAAWTYTPGSKLLFSYHSTLVADIEAGDTYQAECTATSVGVASRLGIAPEDWAVSWQCRFDSREWLQPTPESVLERWATTDVADVAVVCPVFSTDCIETLVDCEVEQRAAFEHLCTVPDPRFTYVPALNDSDAYMDVLAGVVGDVLHEG